MASIFRPVITRWLLDGKRVPAGTPGATQHQDRARKWYGKGVPGWPPSKKVPLASSKPVAQRMLADLVEQAERGQARMVDLQSASRPITDHLNDFLTSTAAGDVTPKHLATLRRHCTAIIQGCRFTVVGDITGTAVERYLASMGQDRSTILPDGEWFSRSELADALGVTVDAVSKMVRVHRLAAEGSGPRRRYPRETAEAITGITGRGAGPRTRQSYLVSFRAFVGWLRQKGLLLTDLLADVRTPRLGSDVRRARRALTAAELGKLFVVAHGSDRVFRGLTGIDREHIYLTACGTGFRLSELASLTPAQFDLDSTTPIIRLGSKVSKNRRKARQPLGADVAAALRSYLAGRPPTEPVWPGTWHDRGAQMIRADLDEAGIEYVIQDPDGDGLLYADFHSLRHSYITLLDGANLSLAQAMSLARHSDPRLTAKRYTHTAIEGLASALDSLPIGQKQNEPITTEEALEWGWMGWHLLAVVLGVVPAVFTDPPARCTEL